MQVFKAFMKIVLSRFFIPLMYIGIFLGISFMIVFNQSDAFDKFSGQKLTMTVCDNDSTPESKALIDYLSETNDVTVTTDLDTDKLMLNMFYQKCDCLVSIKKGYAESVSQGIRHDLFETSYIEGSYAASMAQNQLDKYVSVLASYTARGLDMDYALEKTASLMKTEAAVTILSEQTENTGMTGSGKAYFRYLPYIFIGMMVSTLVPALLKINDRKIKARTNASCLSQSKQFFGVLLGTFIYAFAVWLIFMAAAAIMFGGELFGTAGLLSMLNTVSLMCVTIAISLLTANLLKTPKPADMVATTVGLGMSFLCGVFVPLEYLSDGVKTVAHALPAYWYIRASDTALTDGSINVGEFFIYFGIQLAFAAVIMLASLFISYKKRRALN